jgi:hypothetical protein
MRLFLLLFLVCVSLTCLAQQDSFFPEGTFLPSISAPAQFFGFPAGQRPLRYDDVIRYFTYLAEKSPRVRLHEMGRTYEGRAQVIMTVGAEGRDEEAILAANAKLADPRTTTAAEAARLATQSPLVVWAAYGIHGDEISSVDAVVQIVYRLAAGTDSAVTTLLRDLFVVIEPMENPDGRERFLAQMQQWGGEILNPDAQSLQHTGVWPYGRGNHYLFDVNRDWILMTQVETRNRLKEIVKWNPQLVIDSHEMGAYDTYLFSPPREPINTNVGNMARRWWPVFAADQAKAFDRFGWSYYTREWNDEWYPGYGSSWCLYVDGVGILYEQAGVDGSLVKRPDGTTMTYRETVKHHVVSSFSNLRTAAAHRKEMLNDFYAGRLARLNVPAGQTHTYFIPPGVNPSRVERLVQSLITQGIEVRKTTSEARMSDLSDWWGTRGQSKTLPAGSYVIAVDQPRGGLASAILEFDPRMKTAVLQEERKSLEKENDSKLYDVTAWSLPITYGVEAYRSTETYAGAADVVTTLPVPAGGITSAKAAFGYVFPYDDDRAVDALAHVLDQGITAHTAKEPFVMDGRSYGRGAIVIRKNENGKDLEDRLQDIAHASGVTMFGVNTALSTSGADLGGNDMLLLTSPRIALVGGPEISSASMGAVWYLLDNRLRLRISMLTVSQLNGADLQKYNVLCFPSGSAQAITRGLGKSGLGKLRGWIEGGGTLVALGGAADAIADSTSGLSAARQPQQALKELEWYTRALSIEKKAAEPSVDSVALWEGRATSHDTLKSSQTNERELAYRDERARLFMPRGTFMAVDLDPEHWLSFGMGRHVAALMFGSTALLARDPVVAPGRFADAEHLRLAGLLWPEARERWARTAYVTREAKGRGQIILFAGDPAFRGAQEGTQRLLMNSLLLGPGCGTVRPVEW